MRFFEFRVRPVDSVYKTPQYKPRQSQPYISKTKKTEPAAKLNFAHELEKYKRLPEGNDQEFYTGGSKGLPYPGTYEQEAKPFIKKGQRRIIAMTNEEIKLKDLSSAVIEFYKTVPNFKKEPVKNYDELTVDYLNKTNGKLRNKLEKIFNMGKKNPYLQGGIITTIGALLAGSILSFGSKYGLSPTQTNILLQGILNTVIPTLVSRINGRDWKDTIKYTLASAGTGVGIASLTEKWSTKYKRSINCNSPKGFSQRAHCQGRKKK